MDEQRQAVAAFVAAGLTVKINTTLYPGHNADHVETIARIMAGLGATIMAVVPFWPGGEGGGGESGNVAAPDMDLLDSVREKVARHISLMPSWGECGRDLVGLEKGEAVTALTLPRPVAGRPNVAVASATGMDVGPCTWAMRPGCSSTARARNGLACLLETRDAPGAGWRDQPLGGPWPTRWAIVSPCSRPVPGKAPGRF